MKCETCENEANTEVDGHVFCTPCYEQYFYNHPKGCLDWKAINKQTKREEKTKTLEQWLEDFA